MLKHLFYVAFIFLLWSCTGYSGFVATQVQMPLLTKKDNLMLRVSNPYEDVEITRVEIGLSATKKISDLSSISVYISPTTDFNLAQLFGESQSVAQQVNVEGRGYFRYKGELFIKAKTNDSVDLLNKISIDKVVLYLKNGKTIDIKISPNNKPQRMGLTLRQKNQDGIDTYRIPGLSTTVSGTLIAVYDNRYDNAADLQGNIDVGMSRSTDGGKTWEPMKTIMDMGKYGGKGEDESGIGDPCVLVDKKTNTIWVAALWQHGGKNKRVWWASKPGLSPEQTGQMMLVKSEDDGKTWSEPINITEQVKNPEWYLFFDGPGKGISLEDGTLVFPAQYKDKNQVPHSTIMYSKDGGNTWKVGKGAYSHTTESQVVQLQDGSVMLNMRDDRNRPYSNIANDHMKALNEVSIKQKVFWADSFDIRNQFYQKDDNLSKNKIRFRLNRNLTKGLDIIPVQGGGYFFDVRYSIQDSYPFLNDLKFARTVMVSSDLGETWKAHTSSRHALPASNCMASIIGVNSGGKRFYFFSNPSVQRGRNHLTIKMSDDEAVTWDKYSPIVLYEDETYGYSCMTSIDDQYIGILYEGKGDLYFQKIPISDFIKNK